MKTAKGGELKANFICGFLWHWLQMGLLCSSGFMSQVPGNPYVVGGKDWKGSGKSSHQNRHLGSSKK